MTTAVYACGAGFGHLTRVRAALGPLGMDPGDTVVLVRGEDAVDDRLTAGLAVRRLPEPDDPFSATGRRHLGRQLRSALEDLGATRVVLDAFPAGIRGEISAEAIPAGTTVDHLARLLRWEVYEPVLPDRPVRLDRVWLLEPLHPAHLAWLRRHARTLDRLELTDPAEAADDCWPSGRAEGRRWLVVHSGPPAEVAELVAFAVESAAAEGIAGDDLDLVLVAPRAALPPQLDPTITHVDRYPITGLLPLADRIVTAGGFNAMRSTEPYAARHLVLPFERRLDDQHARVRQRRDALRARSHRS